MHARLRAGLLLGQDHLTAAELNAGTTQIERRLERKCDGSVEILMETIVVAFQVSQEERRRAALLTGNAFLQEGLQRRWKRGRASQPAHPLVCDRYEFFIQSFAQRLNALRQRICKVLVLTFSEGVAFHHDPAAKQRVVVVERAQKDRFTRLNRTTDQGKAALEEFFHWLKLARGRGQNHPNLAVVPQRVRSEILHGSSIAYKRSEDTGLVADASAAMLLERSR